MTARFTARELVEATGGRQVAGGDAEIAGVSTDTRTIAAGSLFVALKGERFDAHDFVAQALDGGAAGLLVGAAWWDAQGAAALGGRAPAGAVIAVADTLRALGDLARFNRRRHGVRLVAMTGSNGKTTLKEMVGAILDAYVEGQGGGGRVLRTRGNFNNLIGLPLTLLELEADHRFAVIEAGMSVPGEIARLAEIAEPDVAIFNNAQPAHLQGLGSVEAIGHEKGALYLGLRPGGTMIVNAGDPHVVAAAERARAARGDLAQLRFATDEVEAEVQVVHVVAMAGDVPYSRVTLNTPEGALDLELPQLGQHNALNAAAATAAALALGVAPETAAAGLKRCPYTPGRLQVKDLAGLRVLDDTYNANPGSMSAALEVLRALAHGVRTGAAFGEMRELGASSARLHRELGVFAVNAGVRVLVAMGAHGREVIEGAQAAAEGAEIELQTLVTDDPADAAAFLAAELPAGAWVVVKGSRGARMERVVDALRARDGAGGEDVAQNTD